MSSSPASSSAKVTPRRIHWALNHLLRVQSRLSFTPPTCFCLWGGSWRRRKSRMAGSRAAVKNTASTVVAVKRKTEGISFSASAAVETHWAEKRANQADNSRELSDRACCSQDCRLLGQELQNCSSRSCRAEKYTGSSARYWGSALNSRTDCCNRFRHSTVSAVKSSASSTKESTADTNPRRRRSFFRR